MRYCLILLLVFFAHKAAYGSSLDCGEPPPVANEMLKGSIVGKAEFISKFLGGAELSGVIEKSKTDLFSSFPDADESRANAFLLYQVCIYLKEDASLSTRAKIAELLRARAAIYGKNGGASYDPPTAREIEWAKEKIILNAVRLSMFPSSKADGAEILISLDPVLKFVKRYPSFEDDYSKSAASLWRTVGGAELINKHARSGPIKAQTAIPALRRSFDLDNSQKEIRDALPIIEELANTGSVNMKDYLRNVLLIARGTYSDIEKDVNLFSEVMKGPELTAERWFFNEAAGTRIRSSLQALELLIEDKTGKDIVPQTTTVQIDQDIFEITTQIGPNTLKWKVNYRNKTYRSENKFTGDFLDLMKIPTNTMNK